MNEAENPDLTKSWVFVNPDQKQLEDNGRPSGVEEVVENDSEPHGDSDTDSISVISESGCSYKTDEEEFVPAASEESVCYSDLEVEPPKVEVVEAVKPDLIEAKGGDKCLYFATSAVCAIFLIGFSVAIQYYFYSNSDVNSFNNDFEKQDLSQYVQNVKNEEHVEGHARKFIKKRSQKFGELPNKRDENFRDKIALPNVQVENNDLTVDGDVKSNFKPNKNKNLVLKFNKENCDESDIPVGNSNDKIKKSKKRDKQNFNDDENCNKRIKELKIKEDYLNEKEKFLIEKEHNLLKKEIKLNKEKSGYEKNYFKRDKEHKHTSEEYVKGKKDKHKLKYSEENNKQKNYKKYSKEEKKRSVQNQQKIDDETNKKKNTSGQWYINMHKARNYLRQKERASDWVFDRAQLRSMKRNKAHWYFQWMVDRARLRVK